MGSQARAKRLRREVAGVDAARRKLERVGALARDPAMQALAGRLHDEECQASKDRDRPAQVRRLQRDGWVLREPNRDGIGCWDHNQRGRRLVHSIAREKDGQAWAHVSLSSRDGVMPGWEAVRDAGWLLYPDQAGGIVVAPMAGHVNLNEVAHIWYKLTGDDPVVPDFSHGLGTI
jgi:hypothetical protein